MAHELARLSVPAVIGFEGQIDDPSCLRFTRALYSRIFHMPIDLAIRDARRVLVADGSFSSLAQMKLFLRTPDTFLFKPNVSKLGGVSRG